MPIWVETTIQATLEEVWRRTQEPALHAQWDLRFSGIDYLPRESEDEPQRFLYRARIGFGAEIKGEGESKGERNGPDARTSALRFWSNDPKSLIDEGSGYWQYETSPNGVHFCTVYDYRVRFGAAGRVLDRLLFRPLLAWATAWSFDRLRRWCEEGTPPLVAARQAAIHAVSRSGLALVWIYEGLVPKLLFPDSGELALVRHAVGTHAATVITIVGIAEVFFGLALLVAWHSRRLLAFAIVALVFLLSAGAATDPGILVTPFSAGALTLASVALAAVALVAGQKLPSAGRCRWSSRREQR